MTLAGPGQATGGLKEGRKEDAPFVSGDDDAKEQGKLVPVVRGTEAAAR